MTGDDPTARAELRQLVRRGYDAISFEYRSDDGQPNPAGAEDTARYVSWLKELADQLPSAGRVLDLGCGAGVPAASWLADAGFDVTGVDFSSVQIERARRLVPKTRFICEDLVSFDAEPDSFDAVISLYTLIHVPLQDQRELLPRLAQWLRPRGLLLAVVGDHHWSGVEDYMGTPMYWDHADAATYVEWIEASGLRVLWQRFVPEGRSGHQLILARSTRAPGC